MKARFLQRMSSPSGAYLSLTCFSILNARHRKEHIMFPQVRTTNALAMMPGSQMFQREAELLAELEIPKGDKPKPVKAAAGRRNPALILKCA